MPSCPRGAPRAASWKRSWPGKTSASLPVRVRGAVRANVSLVEPDGTVTKVNAPGPTLSEEEQEALLGHDLDGQPSRRLGRGLRQPAPWREAGLLRPAHRRLRQRGAKVALDTSDVSLELGLPAGPNLVKPNRDELSAVTGRPLLTLGDVVEAAKLVQDKGAQAVLVSLGADGAVLVDETGATHGEAPVAAPRSAVGAGDALLAGFLASGGQGASCLQRALCWGAAATALPGSRMPAPGDLDRYAVVVHDRIDLDRRLASSLSGGPPRRRDSHCRARPTPSSDITGRTYSDLGGHPCPSVTP